MDIKNARQLKVFSRHSIARSGGDIALYASKLSQLHEELRLCGRPYTEHLWEVAIEGQGISAKRYEKVVKASGLMHDLGENKGRLIVVLNPLAYNPCQGRLSVSGLSAGRLVLNDELVAFGKEGELATFVVYLATREKTAHRTKLGYYMELSNDYDRVVGNQRINSLTGNNFAVSLVLTMGCVKPADIFSNTNPDERYYWDKDLEKIREAIAHGRLVRESLISTGKRLRKDRKSVQGEAERRGERRLMKLLEKMGVSDQFVREGRVDFDEGRFVRAMEAKFEAKKRRVAADNLACILPRIEQRLLIRPGLLNDEYHSERAVETTSGVYDYVALDKLMTRITLNCLDIRYVAEGFDPNVIYEAKEAGDAEMLSSYRKYTSVIERIRLAVRDDIRDFERGFFSRFTSPPGFFFREAYRKAVQSGRVQGYTWEEPGTGGSGNGPPREKSGPGPG